MSSVFELKKPDGNTFQFDYLNSQGERLLMSTEFASKDAAEQAIKDVRVGSMMSEMIAVAQTGDKQKFFVIKNAQGDVLVKSILFDTEMVFNNALHSVRDNACIADIKDLT